MRARARSGCPACIRSAPRARTCAAARRSIRSRRTCSGRDTQLRSLEIAAEDFTAVGGCDIGYACSYVNTLSWRTPTTPLPMQTDPRVVFERLFGEALGAEQRRRQLTQDQSILDAIVGQVGQLQKRLGAADTARVNEYLDSVREVERRVQKMEARVDRAYRRSRRCRSACRISTTTTSG